MRNSFFREIVSGTWWLIVSIAVAVIFAVSCSNAGKLAPGEFELSKNIIQIEPGNDLKNSQLTSYIKQQPAAFSLFSKKKVAFNPELVEASAENLANHLEYLGYYGSRVESETDYRNGKVNVTYNVYPGKQYPVDSISFDLPQEEEFVREFLADSASIHALVGKPLSESALVAESERMSSYLLTKGYYGVDKNYFTFVADTLSGNGTADLQIIVNPTQPLGKYYVSSVQLSLPESLKIKDNLLRQYVTLKPGQMYNSTDAGNTYSRLSSMSVFGSVGVELTPRPDTNLVDCNINLTPSGVQGYKVNLEASTNSSGLMGISPKLSYYHKNIFHGGEWLNLSFMGNFQFMFNSPTRSNEFGISAGISLPRFLGLPISRFKGASIPRTEINTSFNYQDRPEYTRRIASVSYGYSGKTSGNLSYQFYPLQVNVVKLIDIDEAFKELLERNPFMAYAYDNHFDAGLGGTIYLSDNQSINPSTSFKYLRYSMDLAGNVISFFGSNKIFGLPYSQYIRGELTLGKTFRFGRNDGQAIASRIMGGIGYAYGNSAVMPFEKQFYAGGASSMRGWQARTLGPGTSPVNKAFSIPSQTGDFKLEANVEYRFNLFWKLAGALFLDVGNIWTLQNMELDQLEELDQYKVVKTTFDLKSLAADWGVGVRCDLNYLVIRLDMGMKVYEPSRELPWVTPNLWLAKDGFAIHFGVGYPF